MMSREVNLLRRRERAVANSKSRKRHRPRLTKEHEHAFNKLRLEVVSTLRRSEVAVIYRKLHLTKDGYWVYFMTPQNGINLGVKKLRQLIDKLKKSYRLKSHRLKLANKILDGLAEVRDQLRLRQRRSNSCC